MLLGVVLIGRRAAWLWCAATITSFLITIPFHGGYVISIPVTATVAGIVNTLPVWRSDPPFPFIRLALRSLIWPPLARAAWRFAYDASDGAVLVVLVVVTGLPSTVVLRETLERARRDGNGVEIIPETGEPISVLSAAYGYRQALILGVQGPNLNSKIDRLTLGPNYIENPSFEADEGGAWS